MRSAPAHIPAITLISLGTGFAAPDRIRGVVIDTFAAMISGSRVCWASPSIGTNPAHDTRLSLSKRAESVVNLWDTRTGNAFLKPDRSAPRNTYRSSSEGTFLIHTPLSQHSWSTDPGAKTELRAVLGGWPRLCRPADRRPASPDDPEALAVDLHGAAQGGGGVTAE